jgi:hypothetical protein
LRKRLETRPQGKVDSRLRGNDGDSKGFQQQMAPVPRDCPDCMLSLFALDDTVLPQNDIRIVEYASCSFEVQAVVPRLVDPALPCIPFEAHQSYRMYNGRNRKVNASKQA